MTRQVYDEIQELIGRIVHSVQGLLAVLLFGSYARGDFDEGSDIDLLFIFQDRQSLDCGQELILKATGETALFTQPISATLDEVVGSPLAASLVGDTKLLFASQGFKLEDLVAKALRPYALVTYDISHLSPRKKVGFVQTLQGRGKGRYTYSGLLDEWGGFKVGRNIVMIPRDAYTKLTDYLDRIGIRYVTRHVWSA